MVGSNPTGGGAPIQQFLNSELPPGTLRQQSAKLLTSKDLVRNIRGMSREDQKKFIDKADQVHLISSSFLSGPLLYYFYKDIPYFRLTKCEIYRHPGERMQRSPAPPDLRCAH